MEQYYQENKASFNVLATPQKSPATKKSGFWSQNSPKDIFKQVQNKKLIQECEQKIFEQTTYITLLKRQIKDFKKKEKSVLNELTYLDKELATVKNEQSKHYHDLLSLGLDPR